MSYLHLNALNVYG